MPVDYQELPYEVTGQALVIYPPEGVPSEATVEVFPWDAGDDATAETATTGSVTLGGVSTTTDAAAGTSQANAKLVPLTATTNIAIGESYLLTDASGLKEWVEVTAIDAGVSVTARTALLNDYASGATFVETKTSISVIDSWIQDANKISGTVDPNPGWRIRWQYTIDSVEIVRYTFADVVRQAGQHNVTPDDMALYLGMWQEQLPDNHRVDQGRKLIEEAYRLVELELHAVDIPDHQLRNQDVIDEGVKRAANVVLQRYRFFSGSSTGEEREEAMTELNQYFDRFFRVKDRVARATDATGAGTRVRSDGVFRR